MGRNHGQGQGNYSGEYSVPARACGRRVRMTPRLTWWTPFTYLFPSRYVDTSETVASLDLESWSRTEYDWVSDAWNGFRDFAKPPAKTLVDEEGDCEDYALVAASWALANERSGVGIAFCIEKPKVWPTHVIAFDDERVYSSGNINQESVDSWLEGSDYDYALRRRIRLPGRRVDGASKAEKTGETRESGKSGEAEETASGRHA